jgi:hypothetical protein
MCIALHGRVSGEIKWSCKLCLAPNPILLAAGPAIAFTSEPFVVLPTTHMATSDYFRHTLLLEQDSVAEESYDRTVGLIFEKESEKAKLEARCWSELDLSSYQRNGTSSCHTGAHVVLESLNPAAPSQQARLTVLDLDLEQLRQFVHVRASFVC